MLHPALLIPGTIVAFLAVRALSISFLRGASAGADPSGFRSIGTDEMFHLLLVRAIRANGHRPVRTLAGYRGYRQTYPWLLHWLLSYAPEAWLPAASRGLGSACDALVFTAAQVLLWALLSGTLDDQTLGWLLLANLALFVSTPLLTRERTGKLSLRARPLGVLFVSLGMAMLWVYHASGAIGAYALALLPAAAVFVTSKFAVQALVGLCLGIGLGLGSPAILVFPAVAFGLSLPLTRGWSGAVLRAQIGHLRLYWTHLFDSYVEVREKGRLSQLRRLRTRRHFAKNLYRIYNSHPIAQLVVGLPFVVAAPAVWRHARALPDPVGEFALAWLTTGGALMLLTSFGRLKILGQAERYLDFCVIPYAFLSALYLVQAGGGLSAVLLGFGLVMSVQNFRLRQRTREGKELGMAAIREAFEWVQIHGQGARILPIPLNWCHYAAFITENETVECFGPILNGETERFLSLVSEYPWPAQDAGGLARREGCELIVAQRGKRLGSFELDGFETAFENDAAVVLRATDTKAISAA